MNLNQPSKRTMVHQLLGAESGIRRRIRTGPAEIGLQFRRIRIRLKKGKVQVQRGRIHSTWALPVWKTTLPSESSQKLVHALTIGDELVISTDCQGGAYPERHSRRVVRAP